MAQQQEERVIAGSRRPDGTLRKEVRIRAGFTPQDEQRAYVPAAVLARQNVPKCPGFEPDDAAGAKAGPKSAAAKKNEKRKAAAKKQEDGSSSGDGAAGQLAGQLQAVSLQGGAKDAAASTSGGAAAAVAASPEAAPVDPAAAAEKQVKALRKKLRQCEALAERKATGTTLSAEEEEKLSKAAAWQQEVELLEKQFGLAAPANA